MWKRFTFLIELPSINVNKAEAFKFVKDTADQLRDLDQKASLRKLAQEASKLDSEEERKEFVDAVYALLASPEVSDRVPASDRNWLFSLDSVVCASMALIILISYFEVGLPLLWSVLVGFVSGLLLRIVIRFFDRGFFFRRLLTTWIFAGLTFVLVPTFALAVQTDFASFEWGGPPSNQAIVVWLFGLLILGVSACVESYKHNWS